MYLSLPTSSNANPFDLLSIPGGNSESLLLALHHLHKILLYNHLKVIAIQSPI